MEKEQRNRLQKATQDARRLLEEEFRSQLLQTYDIDVDKVRWAEEPGAHLLAEQRLIREKLIAWIDHKEAQINDRKEALLLAQREMAFTALNRFVALKLMEARELVRPCVSGGLESAGFLEFTAVAQDLLADQESSYRLYLETIFEDVSRELRALFDPRDPASLLWPKRTTLLEFLDILNRPELAELWSEDETLGWVYQYFNGDAERKKMREESAAPRNSRELAVRNQFFTPRYVVEFLTDNTLGRIWYEMRQGRSGLKERCRYLVRRPNEIWLQPGEEAPAQQDHDEAFSQEELLLQPVHIPYRQLKDPREIRMLDPACGSMHFGLYAFDLYLEIYAEAWEIAQGSDEQANLGEAFITYAAGFASKAAFLCEVPRLILRHNIHGIDIDPRATQIARLTLWLRAQRAWQEQQFEVAGRPAITRSNVVCAEPMPGKKELLADFVDQQFAEEERGLVQQLLETIFDKMQLAGEAGSLLKIEVEIRDSIDQGRREWQKLAIQQRDLFSAAEMVELGGAASSLNTDLQNLTKEFWSDIEERIYTALRHFAEQANDGSYERRLFAEDAAQGFAFIDIYRNQYDVALMNPPFGECSLQARETVERDFPESKSDLYAAFFERGLEVVGMHGLVGALTSRLALFVSSLERWREKCLLGEHRLQVLADLGHNVLDAALVEAAAYISQYCSGLNTCDLYWAAGLLDSEDKRAGLRGALDNADESVAIGRLSSLARIPGKALAYWLPQEFLAKILEHPAMSESGMQAWVGLQTDDDFRFLRLAWEYPQGDTKSLWRFFAKGGEYSPFYDDFHLVVNWSNEAAELRAFIERKYSWTKRASSAGLYGQPGLTYPERTTSEFSLRPLPAGTVFSIAGPAVIHKSLENAEIFVSLAYTRIYRIILEMFIGGGDAVHSGSAARHYKAGILNQFPVPSLNSPLGLELAACGRGCIEAAMGRWFSDETSRLFFGLPLCVEASLREFASARLSEYEEGITKLERLTGKADSLACRFYGIDDCDALLRKNYGIHPASFSGEISANIVSRQMEIAIDSLVDDVAIKCGYSRQTTKLAYWTDRRYEAIALLNNVSVAKVVQARRDSSAIPSWLVRQNFEGIVSYLLGCVFGRWDIRHASGEHALPKLPDPFAPLPACSPGQLQNAHGFPSRPEEVPPAYPLQIPWEGILVDDPNNSLDLMRRVIEVIEIIWSGKQGDATAKAIEHEACQLLGVKTLRDYFRKPACFFANHLSRYSKSRRQAPIYWLLSAGNGNYSAWVYYHRFTNDTLYRVLRDFIEPRIQQAEREQFELESQGALSGDAAACLQEAQALLQDLRILKSELDLVAPLWNPNLNDGVIINHAILWRITPYTPWQKKCKECWDKLVKGDYDWAHLAFHLWSERVIPKCTTDRSLAIAHGLEDRLWQETNNGNWLPRQLSESDLQALIAEHSNPAVKNALERFLAAPPPVAPTRTRASRSTRASGSSAPRRPRGTAAVVDAEATRQVLLALAAAPSDGLAKAAIADLIGVEANALTAVIKQLKESGQIDQLGERRGARYVLSEQGLAAVASETEVNA